MTQITLEARVHQLVTRGVFLYPYSLMAVAEYLGKLDTSGLP